MFSRSKLKVLFVSSEMSPYAVVGGLGQVIGYLPKALLKIGVDVRVMMPYYGKINRQKYNAEMVWEGMRITTGNKEKPEIICNLKKHQIDRFSPQVYFVENKEYYELRENVYGYSDDYLRWGVLQKTVAEFIQKAESVGDGWTPDIIHCHDWMTGLMPQILPKKTKTVFTIHNLQFQGPFDYRFVKAEENDDGKKIINDLFSPEFGKQNSVKRGVMYSDLVTTVSDRYAKEILTPEFSCGLDTVLKQYKHKLYGVLNGLDYRELNPSTDRNLKANYSGNGDTEEKRGYNKRKLQEEMGLEVSTHTPLICFSSRMDTQKGLDLFVQGFADLLKEFNFQFIANGDGESRYKTYFHDLAKQFPQRVAVNFGFNLELVRRMFAGCNLLLIPSLFEPCGLVQMEAMRYGCVPVARDVGGLADTISDRKTGFLFKNFTALGFNGAIIRALEYYKDQKNWQIMVKTCMKEDFSWEKSAKRYRELYEKLLG